MNVPDDFLPRSPVEHREALYWSASQVRENRGRIHQRRTQMPRAQRRDYLETAAILRDLGARLSRLLRSGGLIDRLASEYEERGGQWGRFHVSNTVQLALYLPPIIERAVGQQPRRRPGQHDEPPIELIAKPLLQTLLEIEVADRKNRKWSVQTGVSVLDYFGIQISESRLYAILKEVQPSKSF